MTQQRKLLFVVCACLLILIGFLFLRPSQPEVAKTTGAAANGRDSGLSTVVRTTPLSVLAGSTVIAGDASSTAARAKGESAGSAAGLGWSKAVSIRDTKWAIEQLSISNDPNDRLRAYALSVMCTNILLQPLEAYKSSFDARKKTPEQRRDIAQMREDMESRCGSPDNGNPYLPSSATTQGMRSARAAQVPLSIALDTSLYGVVKNGLTAAEGDALSGVMKDESLRSAWLSKSLMGGFGQELSTSASFPNIPADEMTAALMTVMCRSGDDCGAESVYRPYLCFTSSFRYCDGATVADAIAAGLSPESTARFENTVRSLQAAFAAGDLNALGLRRTKS